MPSEASPFTVAVIGLFISALMVGQAVADVESEAAAVPVSRLEMPTDPRALPYQCVVVDSNHSGNGVFLGDQVFANLDDDEYHEVYAFYSGLIDSSHYQSALLTYPHDLTEGGGLQYNGPFLCCRILSHAAMDVMGGPGEEVILSRQNRDTLVMEVATFSKVNGELVRDTAIWFPAAVATEFAPRQYWHTIHLNALTAFDVNGDGAKELVYSRSAKPDSAIARGLVAYDIANRQTAWFFPTADLVSRDNAIVLRTASGDSCLAVAIHSCNNLYEANGLGSWEAYALALDLQGHELWRTSIGPAGYSPALKAYDVDGDGYDEVCVSSHPDLPEHPGVIVRAYDPFTGKLVAAFNLAPGQRNSQTLLNVFSGELFALWRDETSTWVARLGKGLKPTRLWQDDRRGRPTVAKLEVLADRLIAHMTNGHAVIVDRDLEPQAMFSQSAGYLYAGRTTRGPVIMVSEAYQEYKVLTVIPQSLWVQLYARYQIPMQTLAAVILLALLWVVVDRVRTWRQAALGVPTLGSIDALVLLLDRKGRLLFANRHRLAERLLGRWRRRRSFMTTGLAAYPEVAEAIRQSYDTPLRIHQQRAALSQSDDGVELSIYPYVDRHNIYRGKIVVMEELQTATARQWRVVLGEAAQNWVHRLKHQFGTIRLIVTNLVRDPIIAERLRQSPDLAAQRQEIEKEVLAGSTAATKILKYLKTPPPRLAPCDITAVAGLAVGAKRTLWDGKVAVSFSQQADLPLVYADPDQMREVFDNLLSNAAQAMPEGGTVTIAIALAGGLLSGGAGRCVEVKVSDTGIGIPPEDLPHLFEPNFSRTLGGTGIGLALARDVVTGHNGEIVVRSTVGVGTTFVVRLPAERTSNA